MSEPVSSSPPEKEAKPGLSVEGSSKKLNEDSRTEAHAKDLEEVVTVGQGMGHQFEKKSFFQLTYCHHCADLLWGIKGQSFMCQGNANKNNNELSMNTGLPLFLSHYKVPIFFMDTLFLCCCSVQLHNSREVCAFPEDSMSTHLS